MVAWSKIAHTVNSINCPCIIFCIMYSKNSSLTSTSHDDDDNDDHDINYEDDDDDDDDW